MQKNGIIVKYVLQLMMNHKVAGQKIFSVKIEGLSTIKLGPRPPAS